MGHRHNTLSDNIFRNCKFMKAVNENAKSKDFRKEYKEQYDFMLDTFSTLILLNNCFFSDSNLSINDKVENSQKIIGKYLYSDFDENTNETISENGKKKYSVRFIQDICEKHTTHLYRRINEWYFDYLDNYTPNSNIDLVLDDIEKEMERLEKVGFDDIVKDNINYKKNKNSNHKIYICKFNTLYYDYENFTNEFIKEYNDNHINLISEEEIGKIGLLYTLIAKCCNGITKTLDNKPIIEYEINTRTNPTDLFNIYLKELEFNENRFDFRMEALQFMLEASLLYSEVAKRGISFSELMNNYDMYYFFTTMKNVVLKKDFVITDEQIQKDLKDLEEIYKLLMTKPKDVNDTLSIFSKGFDLIQNLMNKKRISNYYVRIS